MNIRIAAAALCVLISGPASANSLLTSGTITALRNYTKSHGVPTAQGVTILQLTQALQGGCAWAFILPEDKNALATALAAKSAGSPVVIWYEPTMAAPWGDTGVCALTGIEVAN